MVTTLPQPQRHSCRPGAWRKLTIVGIGSLASFGVACGATAPLLLEPEFTQSVPGADVAKVALAPAIDARRFTGSANRAPVPSVQGDPSDRALTSRVIGRRVATTGMLASNVTLPPDETVAQWAGLAVAEGLHRAGITTIPADRADPDAIEVGDLPRLEVTVLALWLDIKGRPPKATIEYRTRIEIMGDWPRFREGQIVEARGTLSAGGLDMTLWRRTFDRALTEIANQTSLAANPGGF